MKIHKKILALVLLAAITLTLTSCSMGKTTEQTEQTEQPESAMLTIADPSGSIDWHSTAELQLCGCDIGGGTITLNFSGVATDGLGTAPNGGGGGTYSIADTGYCLQIGEELCTDGKLREVIINDTIKNVEMSFKVSESALASDKSCALLHRGNEEEDYSELLKFSLTEATDLQSLSGVQSVQEANGTRVAAAVTELDDGYTCVKLYSESSNGLELTSYGIGGGSSAPDSSFWQMGLLDGTRRLCLQTGNETLDALELTHPWYNPSSFVFNTGNNAEFTLDLPHVVFRSDEVGGVSQSFSDSQQLENFTQSVPLEYGVLNLEVQKSESGELRLCGSVERKDETLRLCGLDITVGGKEQSIAFGEIGASESPMAPLSGYEDSLQPEAGLEISISGVYYAQVVDLELPLTIN